MISKPLAPKDPTEKRNGFYVFIDKEIGSVPQNDGSNKHPIYLDDNRLVTFAKIVGGVEDEKLLDMLNNIEDFKKLIHSIGISATCTNKETEIGFDFICYSSDGPFGRSENHFVLKGDGAERVFELSNLDWSEKDTKAGQFLFSLPDENTVASITIKFYLNDGYKVKELDPDKPVDFKSENYKNMIHRSFLSAGNNHRVKNFLNKLKNGEHVTVAFIGGSITQGAGAVPIQQNCYARQTFLALKEKYGENITYIKAGVGGTPSELGMVRYERDITRDNTVKPDLVVVEFAVNDSSDETKGICYESLVNKILNQENKPAVVLLFAVFADDWNLKDRLAPIGYRYEVPMVDVLEAVTPQFTKKQDNGLVVTKRQYFYDVYHPSNIGHKIMADCLMYMFERLDNQQHLEDNNKVIPAVYGADFTDIHLLDRKDNKINAKISCGSFTNEDTDLQCVPFDDAFENTPEFPYNWQKAKGDEPFILELECSKLVLLFKDSASTEFGKAKVTIDGEKEFIFDPREAGWTHCHASILFNNSQSEKHKIQIEMIDKDKIFTILGFGYV